MRIGIAAVEVSGDRLGAELIRELKTYFPDAEFIGCGGDLMHAEGLEMLNHVSELEAMGVAEVLVRLIPLLRLRSHLIHQLKACELDLFIGVDGPDFNGEVEHRLSRAGVPCVHYVCPTIWVWRKHRAQFFSRVNRQILCLYPCEKHMIEEAGGKATFVGHPLADLTPMRQSHQWARKRLGMEGWTVGRRVVGLMPGSRSSEIASLLPVFLATARIMARHEPMVFLVSAVNQHKKSQVVQLVERYGKDLDLKIIVGKSQQLIASSELMMVASGTASLETLLVKRPMIVAYRVNPFSYWLIRWMINHSGQIQRNLLTGEPIVQNNGTLPLVSQPNLLSGCRLVPEFLQHQVKAKAMAETCLRLLAKDNRELTSRFHKIHLALRNNTASSAAREIIPLLLTHTGQMQQ